MPIKTIILDFDGVVVRRSESFKREAWEHVLAPYGAEGMEAFHAAEEVSGRGRGGDRFTILREIFQHLGKSEDEIPKLVEKTAQDFDERVQTKIMEAGILPEDRTALKELSKRAPLYLSSATPKEALDRTIRNLGLQDIFKKVLGRPETKAEHFRFVASEEGMSPREILFVGDSESDLRVAREFGCEFIGFDNVSNDWQSGDFRITHDLAGVLKYLDVKNEMREWSDDLR